MQRKYERVTDRTFLSDRMKNATVDVLCGKCFIRESALQHDVRKPTLALYVKKARETGIDTYEFAEKNTVNISKSWKEKKMAGKDWFMAFMTRQSDLSNKLETVLKRHQFTASGIQNLDVQKTQKIIATKGHQVDQVTSREKEELITQVGIIGANGTALPSVWVLPRMKYDPHRMLHGASLECDAQSGVDIEKSHIPNGLRENKLIKDSITYLDYLIDCGMSAMGILVILSINFVSDKDNTYKKP
ncbi:hypothetical protein ILUMI_00571 [Ignelater luminosus]|uniref:Uncharacterized protein n=1 Tax=Ignelater luminosus TaxID=2038154 RepID=A0A8K0GMH8_IGNLU|nr:hypothetical protein ILUMI_00571 [Ignelater luminosus]